MSFPSCLLVYLQIVIEGTGFDIWAEHKVNTPLHCLKLEKGCTDLARCIMAGRQDCALVINIIVLKWDLGEIQSKFLRKTLVREEKEKRCFWDTLSLYVFDFGLHALLDKGLTSDRSSEISVNFLLLGCIRLMPYWTVRCGWHLIWMDVALAQFFSYDFSALLIGFISLISFLMKTIITPSHL